MKVFAAPTFRTTPTTSIHPNDRDTFAATLNNFTERTQTSTQIRADFNKATAIRKRAHGFFLSRTPGKPPVNLMPLPANTKPQQQRLAEDRPQPLVMPIQKMHRMFISNAGTVQRDDSC
jgi:hypothetical protein